MIAEVIASTSSFLVKISTLTSLFNQFGAKKL